MVAPALRSLTVVVSLLVAIVALATGQEIPTGDEQERQLQLNNQEIFYDTHLIPDGSEVSSYVTKNISSRFFFIVEEDNTPLAIHISPCSSSITTYVRYQTKPEDDDSDKPDKSDELLARMERLSKKNRRANRPILTHTGRDEVKFQKEISPSGLYSVEIIAHDRDTTIYLYATTTPQSDRLFPELPKDAAIKVISVAKDVVSVAWKPSPTDFHHGIPIEYCVAANQKQNFGRRCAAWTSLYGDVRPTPPPNAGFGFPWEKTTQRSRRKMSHPTAKPPDKERVFYACVGNKTSYTFNNMKASALYYINVFAVNTQTNRSSTYIGTNLTTSACPVQKTAHVRTGKVYKLEAKSPNCTLTLEHALKKSTAGLQMGFQSCTEDRLRVTIEHGRSTVEGELLSEWPVFAISIPNPKLGSYKIRASSTGSRSISFKMAVGTVENGLPFPILPSNRIIEIVENGNRSCRSVTLMWSVAAASQPQQYCLYAERQKRKEHGRKQPHVNRCAIGDSLRTNATKVMCKTVSDNGTQEAVTSMVEVVSDLRPSTRYAFHVVAIKQGREKESVAYDTLNIKTSKC